MAAGFAPLALGSDTGGSIRQPAALCGVVGMKPTYGTVSRYGLVAFASSLDQIGPFATTVADAALLFDVIGGHDPADSTSLNRPTPRVLSVLDDGVAGLTVGVLAELLDGAAPDVVARVRQAAEACAAAGAQVEEVSVPEVALGLSAYYLIAPAEASSNLARYDGVRYGLRVDGRGHRGHEHGHPHGRLRRRGEATDHARAPTCCRPATTTPTTTRRSGSAP